MGDVTRWTIGHADSKIDKDAVVRVLKVLEEGLTVESAEVTNLISASFVENLIGESLAVQLLKHWMGPKLKAAVETQPGIL